MSTLAAATPMSRTYWSCFSHQSGEGLDLLAGYGDALGRHYDFDSDVIHHKQVAAGDLLIIRDAHLVYGYGAVESIASRRSTKRMRRCPACRSSDLADRKRLQPRFRCNDCKATFEAPFETEKAITAYRATYGTWWFPFGSPVSVRALERAYADRDRQNAIRRLVPDEAGALIDFCGGFEGLLQRELLDHSMPLAGGHVEAVVKVRVGQQQFRDRMLERFGPTCAVTGPQPQEVLDAAHLISFALRPEHRMDGGILLRADVHRLFDRLLLTFDPSNWVTCVAPPLLERYEGLREYEGRAMAIGDLVRPDVSLVRDHFAASKARWKAI